MRLLTICLVFLLMGFSLYHNDDNHQDSPKPIMLNDHNKEWKLIDSLERRQLPKSALEQVEVLYKKVRSENNQAQIIKCIIYRNKYLIQLEDKDPSKAIIRLENEVAAEKNEAPKAVLNSMLAQLYFIYAQNNQYKISNRTYTVEEPTDIATWSIESLLKKSNELYLNSIRGEFSNPEILQDYQAILVPNNDKLSFEPDLNSFLLHRVVGHFSNSRSLLVEPVNKFVMNDPELFRSSDEFVKLNIESKDSLSFKYQALLAHQKLLGYLEGRNRIEELTYADLARIEFVKQHLVHSAKDSLYISRLEAERSKNQDNSIYSEICFRVARYYKNQGDKYRQEFDPKFKGLATKALEIAENGRTKYPDSFGAKSCRSLIEQIKQKELSIQVEKVVGSKKPFLVYNTFKNIEELHLKLYKLSRSKIAELEQKRIEEKRAFINSLEPLKEIEKELLNINNDPHAVEHILDGLDIGNYLLVASEKSGIEESELVIHGSFAVSNLAYAIQTRSGKLEILVYDRANGNPISNAQIDVYETKYRRGRIDHDQLGTVFTNANGKSFFESRDRSLSIVVKKDSDVLDLREQYYIHKEHDGRSYTSCNIFTDRNIYRPGQKVYFKGLLLKVDKKQIPKIEADKKVKITLRDANGQVVNEANFRTNEFGTFNGDFDLPSGGLTGSYFIESMSGGQHLGGASINVEEYKRPKFEVSIDTLDIDYKLGDTVEVSGVARMFAGTPLDEVEVKYRVTRETQYPYWSWWRPRPSSPSQEISNGETTTTKDGSFSIEVPLIPGSVNGQSGAVFNYKVEVDVVDVTGETRSAISYIKASRTAVFASLDIKSRIDLVDVKDVNIKTQNINGKHVDVKGIITIEKLETEEHFKIDRYWGKTDSLLVKKEEWEGKVPNYTYQKNKAYDELAVKQQVLQKEFNTGVSQFLDLDERLEVGLFKITTKVGEDENVQYLEINDFSKNTFVSNDLLVRKDLKEAYLPGQTASVVLGSSNKPLYVFYEEERDGIVSFSKWVKLDKVKEQKIEITEKDRGGIFIKLHYALNNRAYTEEIKINVPWTNKDLKLEFTSIRNKIAPGSEEQWQIKITGDKKEKVSAELLATMYDASLDQFAGKHAWTRSFYPQRYSNHHWNSAGYSASYFNNLKYNRLQYRMVNLPRYPSLNWFGLDRSMQLYGRSMARSRNREFSTMNTEANGANGVYGEQEAVMLDEVVVAGLGTKQSKAMGAMAPSSAMINSTAEDSDMQNQNARDQGQEAYDQLAMDQVTPRTNLNETVFFFPDIRADKDGNVTLNFTMNEALTKWKFLTMAHTKELAIGFAEQEITTFKNLMVFPNAPRFMRQGDKLHFSAKVHNMTEETLAADTRIELIDAVSEEKINSLFLTEMDYRSISIAPGASELISWEMNVPHDFTGLVKYRILASDGTYSDGEENYLPTLSNRMLVTETFPMNVKGNETKTFSFDSFKDKSKSTTLTHQNFAIEYTSNPAWYAIQAMPYLMEYEHECSEQLFNRYFANALSSNVAKAHPRIKQVFDSWKANDSDALLSNLSKNQELKSAILAETPWVRAAKSEEEQMQDLAILFDMNRMGYEQDKAIKKLAKRQLGDGGFSWFSGGRSSRYISQYILEGMGHLRKLGVESRRNESVQIINKSIKYTDNEIKESYEDLKERIARNKKDIDDRNISSLDIHYLYARSYFLDDHGISDQEIYDYYLVQAEKYWVDFSLYEQAMICLVLNRNNRSDVATEILKSLKERSILHDELGRYWKSRSGYRWNQHPIEMQSLMIELFAELDEDQSVIDELRIWLLKNKQTNSWKTTKSTAAAIYALMINKDNSSKSWLTNNEQVAISYGRSDNKVEFGKAQAGTLNVKKTFDSSEIKDELGDITVSNSNEVISWGAAYWQYFEDLDNIKTFEDTPLHLKKQLFIEEITDKGPQLLAVSKAGQIQQGDRVKVRIELRVDRAMEFIHMKDMRASGLEPINVISRYKWQDGLGYYESTKDVATHFFFSYLPKGTYVFEYPLRATHVGEFSNGITTIQSMYAPEFSSHSEGVKVKIN